MQLRKSLLYKHLGAAASLKNEVQQSIRIEIARYYAELAKWDSGGNYLRRLERPIPIPEEYCDHRAETRVL